MRSFNNLASEQSPASSRCGCLTPHSLELFAGTRRSCLNLHRSPNIQTWYAVRQRCGTLLRLAKRSSRRTATRTGSRGHAWRTEARRNTTSTGNPGTFSSKRVVLRCERHEVLRSTQRPQSASTTGPANRSRVVAARRSQSLSLRRTVRLLPRRTSSVRRWEGRPRREAVPL